MRTTIDSYLARAGRLDLEGIDFDDFRDRPLPADALRSLRYMHDIEHHTVCYLRDLLLTPAHRDPRSPRSSRAGSSRRCGTATPSGGCSRPTARSPASRASPSCATAGAARRHGTTLSTIGLAAFSGRAFVALHMTWGAVNEWTTQAGYGRLAEIAGHPTLRELLRRIMKQEGGHIDFYASEATRRLADSPKARRLTRFALSRPVASRRFRGDAQPRGRLPREVPLRRRERDARPWRGSTAASIACPGRRTSTCSPAPSTALLVVATRRRSPCASAYARPRVPGCRHRPQTRNRLRHSPRCCSEPATRSPTRSGPVRRRWCGPETIDGSSTPAAVCACAWPQPGCLPVMLGGVLLTHLHSDHICDLNDVITTHWIMSTGPTPCCLRTPGNSRGGRGEPSPCWHPTCPTVWRTMPTSPGSPQVEVHEIGPGEVLRSGSTTVAAAATDHRPVEPTLAYRFDVGRAEHRRGGRHRSLPGPRRAVHRSGRLRADRAARRPGPPRADAAIRRHHRVPLDGRAGGPHGRPGRVWARSSSPTRYPRRRRGRRRSGPPSLDGTSTATSCSART